MCAPQRTHCFHCPTCVCTAGFDRLLSIFPPHTAQELYAELQELQVRTASLKSRVIDALRRRNTTIPISRLPPEILGAIFLYTRDASRNRQWTVVVRTHHAWRTAAISQRRLWSVLDMSYPANMVREMISRAQGVPLQMSLERRVLGPESLHRQLSVWDTLDVSAVAGFSVTAAPKVITVILPRIRAAAAHVQTIELSTISESSALVLTPEVLDGDYPCLSILRLRGHTPPSWGHSLYGAPNLRVLSIVGSDSKPPYMFEPVAASLRLLHRLEQLELHCCLPWKGVRKSPVPAASEQFTLPRLAVLDLKGRPQSCVRLLQYLQVPSTCRTRIYCTERCRAGEQRPLVNITLASAARIHGGYLEGEDEAKIFASRDYTSENAFRYLRVPKPWEYDGSADYDDIMLEFAAIAKVEYDMLSLVPVDLDQCELCPWASFGGSRAKVIHIDWTLAGGCPTRTELELADCFHWMETLILEGISMSGELWRDDDFVEGLFRFKTHLRKVQLVACKTTDDVLSSLRMAHPRIEIEVVDGSIEGRWVRRMVKS